MLLAANIRWLLLSALDVKCRKEMKRNSPLKIADSFSELESEIEVGREIDEGQFKAISWPSVGTAVGGTPGVSLL